jgi:peroxiredoxin
MTSKSLSEQLNEAFLQCRDMEASLAERLQAFADAVRRFGPHFQTAVDGLVARLKQHQVGEHAPKPGEEMPNFILPDPDGRLVSLDSLLHKGPVAVTFHRGHWCPYCRINTRALAEAQNQIAAEGGQVAAIMPDREHFAAALKSESGAPFPILTDIDNGYALSLNLAIWIGEEIQTMLQGRQDLPTFQGNTSWMLPIPATFVVGRDGLIRARFMDPDYRKPMAIADMLTVLRS